MNGLNQLNIIGHVVRDARLETVNVNGVPTPRCFFSVAVNENRSNGREEPTFFDVTAWREYAVNIAPWVLKGRQVHVSGNVRIHTYTTNNSVRSSMQIHNPTVILLGKRPEVNVENIDSVEEIDDDDIPFG